jgi:branched-subunit amino acid transport protein
MTLHPNFICLVLVMGLVTYLPRWLPLFLLVQKRPPRWFTEWLDLIPAAILSALIAPALFTAGEPPQLAPLQLKALVALPTFCFALKTQSLGGTVLFGMVLYWLAGMLAATL